ncbi:MAG: hypothetical protein PHI58_05010 [Candidatus Omnitrophica bacterium]|nr:hypothetical protein [Candidatus Omnitrophota bacterium]
MGSFLNALTKVVTQFLNSKEKEVKKMTKKIISFIMILAFVASIACPAYAVTDQVAATASITLSETFSIATKTLAGDVTVPAKTIAFGTLTGTVTNAPAYIEVAYSSNETLWKIDIYTNNTTAVEANLPYGKAGLLKSDGKDRIPLYWCVFDAPTTPVTLTLDVNGVPNVRTPSMYPIADPVAEAAKNKVTDWAVMKDKNDLDDPSSTDLNESWATAFAGGYCDIAYGSPTYSNLSAFPYYDSAVAGTSGWWKVPPPGTDTPTVYPGAVNNTIHRAATSPAYVYIAAGGGASAGTYSTNIGLDLYHE